MRVSFKLKLLCSLLLLLFLLPVPLVRVCPDPECKWLFLTIGIHPTRCHELAAAAAASRSSASTSAAGSSIEFEAFAAKLEEGGLQLTDYPEIHVQRVYELQQLLQQQNQQQPQRIVAVGEIGLDYDRLHFCDGATQKQSAKLKASIPHPEPTIFVPCIL